MQGLSVTKKRCSVQECTNQAESRGLCVRHQQRKCKAPKCSRGWSRAGYCYQHWGAIQLAKNATASSSNDHQPQQASESPLPVIEEVPRGLNDNNSLDQTLEERCKHLQQQLQDSRLECARLREQLSLTESELQRVRVYSVGAQQDLNCFTMESAPEPGHSHRQQEEAAECVAQLTGGRRTRCNDAFELSVEKQRALEPSRILALVGISLGLQSLIAHDGQFEHVDAFIIDVFMAALQKKYPDMVYYKSCTADALNDAERGLRSLRKASHNEVVDTYIPLHIGHPDVGDHWVLLVIQDRDKRALYFDSFARADTAVLIRNIAKQVLVSLGKKRQSYQVCPETCPQQVDDTTECGVMVCLNAFCHSDNRAQGKNHYKYRYTVDGTAQNRNKLRQFIGDTVVSYCLLQDPLVVIGKSIIKLS